MRTISIGDGGREVATWKRVLAASPSPTEWSNARAEHRTWSPGWSWPPDLNTGFDEPTQAATEAWQERHGLVADGIVGPKTWSAAGAVTEASPSGGAELEEGGVEFVEAKNFTRGRAQPVRLIVVHTTESPEVPRGARNNAAWFATQPRHGTLVDDQQRPDPNGKPFKGTSAHYCVDANEIVQSVREEDTAWHAGAVNSYSIGVEHVGSASQAPAQWHDAFSDALLTRAAALVAERCVRHRIPVTRLSTADLRAGKPGICGHGDVTLAFGPAGGHEDPGASFPWDEYLRRVEERVTRSSTSYAVAAAAVPIAAPPTSGDGWLPVKSDGIWWLVASTYLAPVGIGEAVALARAKECELPSPRLVDAIWEHADLKLDATTLRRSDFTQWTQEEMEAPAVIADQARRIEEAIRGRAFRLLAGSHKDVVRAPDGRIGIYGWQRPNGRPLQPFYAEHAATWRDYSQGLRLVKRG
jgi:hypothetical protein